MHYHGLLLTFVLSIDVGILSRFYTKNLVMVFFLLITSISLIIFLQIKQQSSTKLIGALSSLSSNQGLTTSKLVNQILWHL
jgi:hypothetical protein